MFNRTFDIQNVYWFLELTNKPYDFTYLAQLVYFWEKNPMPPCDHMYEFLVPS